MKKNLVLLLVFLFMATNHTVAVANEEIKGAFGMTLGDVLPEEDSRVTEAERFSRDSGLRYAFDADHPFGALDGYHVLVTPQTRIIYRIIAEGKFRSASRCEEELLALQEVLETKYGPHDDNVADSMVRAMPGMRVIRFGNVPRRIVATCVGFMDDHNLSLNYFADDLEERAKAERARLGEGNYQGLGL